MLKRFPAWPESNMGRKRATKVTATGETETAKAIRLELFPVDHERLEVQARKRGLNKAATARMVVLEWLEEQEKKGGREVGLAEMPSGQAWIDHLRDFIRFVEDEIRKTTGERKLAELNRNLSILQNQLREATNAHA
jgi:predicted nucleic acid-binding Zn ribbon protein